MGWEIVTSHAVSLTWEPVHDERQRRVGSVYHLALVGRCIGPQRHENMVKGVSKQNAETKSQESCNEPPKAAIKRYIAGFIGQQINIERVEGSRKYWLKFHSVSVHISMSINVEAYAISS